MIDLERTFAVASDTSLVELIQRAKRRLVVVSPALNEPVAAALAERLKDLGQLAITVVLDADPEVYRLGYGTRSALDKVRQASKQSLFDLRVQPGVRIGVVISDDVTMLFAPVPLLIVPSAFSAPGPSTSSWRWRTIELMPGPSESPRGQRGYLLSVPPGSYMVAWASGRLKDYPITT